jgi:hypothetical protein
MDTEKSALSRFFAFIIEFIIENGVRV